MSDQQDRINEGFSWQAHPAKERRGRLVVGIVWIGAFVLVVYATTGSTVWAAFSLLVLVVALNRFFFSSRFTIDAGGITAEYPMRTRRLSWERSRRFVHDSDGGYLSPSERPSRLDAWRGLHILFGEQREEVIERIRRRLSEDKGVN